MLKLLGLGGCRNRVLASAPCIFLHNSKKPCFHARRHLFRLKRRIFVLTYKKWSLRSMPPRVARSGLPGLAGLVRLAGWVGWLAGLAGWAGCLGWLPLLAGWLAWLACWLAWPVWLAWLAWFWWLCWGGLAGWAGCVGWLAGLGGWPGWPGWLGWLAGLAVSAVWLAGWRLGLICWVSLAWLAWLAGCPWLCGRLCLATHAHAFSGSCMFRFFEVFLCRPELHDPH